jgi:hypothetical protein
LADFRILGHNRDGAIRRDPDERLGFQVSWRRRWRLADSGSLDVKVQEQPAAAESANTEKGPAIDAHGAKVQRLDNGVKRVGFFAHWRGFRHSSGLASAAFQGFSHRNSRLRIVF